MAMASAIPYQVLGSPSSSRSAMPKVLTSLARLAFLFFLLGVLVLSIWPASQLAKWTMLRRPSSSFAAAAVGKSPLSKARQLDLTLSQAECRTEFPLLFPQLDDNAKAWRDRGGLRLSHLDESDSHCKLGCVRMIIKDSRIFIRKYEVKFMTRVPAVMSLFKTAVETANEEDRLAFEGLDVVFNAFDKDGFDAGEGSGWVFTKRATDPPGQYLLPDFSFAAWPEAAIPSYDEFRRDARKINEQTSWTQKGDRAFFRGDPYAGPGLLARLDLMKQAKKPGAEAWADVQRTSFDTSIVDAAPMVGITEHCKHKYLIHAEGVSYSGRSKFLLGCSSVVLLHKLEWTQSFHPAMIGNASHPDQNVIDLPGEYFEHLATTMLELQEQDAAMPDSSLGRRIAANAQRTLTDRYLTPAATMCYIRGALISYSSVLDRSSYGVSEGPQVLPGGGVTYHSATKPVHELKDKIKGDVEVTTWQLLGHPEWPPS